MRYLAALGALCFLAGGTLASAQVQVSAQTERSDFLLYERVDLLITVANAGEGDLVLDNNEGRPWLSFLVTKPNRLPVHTERQCTFKPITLKVGETKTLRVNLTPLFSFRETGDYKASVVIDLPGAGEIVSEPVPFTVERGRTVWTATKPVDGTERIYSLIRFSPTPDRTNLYLRVEEPNDNLVLANLSLGEVVAYIDPDVYFDPDGNIHVLQPIAMSTYLYSRADASGKVVHQGIFKTFQEVRPRLTKLEDGSVIVYGGLEENPNARRESLAEGEKSAGGQLISKGPDSPDSPAPVNMSATPEPPSAPPSSPSPASPSAATAAAAPDPNEMPLPGAP